MLGLGELTFRLLLAAALGAVIGFERERRQWAAGLRTHMLVCVGSALAMIVSAFGYSDILQQYPHVVLDPSRVAAQVISGIGFLGAGTILILRRENVIRGLTTAAGVWTVAAIGLAVGGGMYAASAVATAVAWVILALLRPLERRFFERAPTLRVVVGFAGRASLSAVEAAIAERRVAVTRLVARRRTVAGDEVVLEIGRGVDRSVLAALADALRALDGVESVAVEARR